MKIPEARLVDRIPCGRVTLRKRCQERVKDFELIECGMTDEEAKQNHQDA